MKQPEPVLVGKERELNFDPLQDVKCFDDLKKFPPFEDDWLRGGPIRRWVPQGLADNLFLSSKRAVPLESPKAEW